MLRKFYINCAIMMASALFSVGCSKNQTGDSGSNESFSIGTYNLWAVSARQAEYDKGNAVIERTWPYSESIVAGYVAELNLDIVGVQEMAPEQAAYLTDKFQKAGLGYASVFFWPDETDHAKQSADGLFYRSSRFVLKDWHRYWISKTPEVQSYGWDEGEYKDAHYHYRYRNAGYCHFYDKLTGRDFIVTVIHAPQYPEARENAARLMKQYEQDLNKARYPSFFIGDMNSNADAVPEDGFNTVMRAYCDDAYKVAIKNNGQKYTFAGANCDRAPYVRYDYIYLHSDEADSFLVEEYAVGVDRFDVNGRKCQPSDHCPVYIKVKLK